MSYKGHNPENFVDEYYTGEKYLECYHHGVTPINGKNMLPTDECEEMLAPQYKRGGYWEAKEA